VSGASLIAPGSLTFSRASARTNPETGAEIASGTAYTTTISEIVPTGMSAVVNSDGYTYIGRLSDGRYVFNGPSGIHTSTNGEPPYTVLVNGAAVNRITPNDTFLRFSQTEPGTIYRRPAPYTTETLVHTLQRGFVVWNGPSGTNISASNAMGYAAHGNTIIVGEYSNSVGIKDDPIDPPRYIHRSTDDGATWSVIEPIGPEANTHVHTLYYDDPTGNWYLCYGDHTATIIGIYRSTDDGLNWTRLFGPTIASEYGSILQPVSAFRFGDYIVWGSDETPTGLWLHDTRDDTLTRFRCDYSDTGSTPIVTWTGIAYNTAQIGEFLIVAPSQGQEEYHKVYVTDDLQHFWKLVDMETAYKGFSQPLVRSDGSFLIKPSQVGSDNFVKVDGITRRTHAAIATDEAVDALAESAIPMDATFWNIAVGEYKDTSGPGGMRVYKLGDFRFPTQQNVSAGQTVEMTVWLRNPFKLDDTTNIMFEMYGLDAVPALTFLDQKVMYTNSLRAEDWTRCTFRKVMPANTVKVSCRLLMQNTTYNASTAYIEAAGLTVSTTPHADIETHNRAAESATVDKSVGGAWGVYDRVFPRWDTYELTANKTLLTLTDVDTSAYLSVIYNATSKAFEITDGSTTETGATVRCMGSRKHILLRTTSTLRSHYGEHDFLSYGVRRTSGGVELVVWDKVNRVVAAVAAPAGFAPSNLRITFPASGVLHVPSFASAELTNAQTFSALQGIEVVAPAPPSEPGLPSELRVIPGGWPVIVPDIVRVW
jgi:hypothetical protein